MQCSPEAAEVWAPAFAGEVAPEAAVWRTLDRYLDPTSTAPIALALSGGGDSIALLRLTSAWAKAHGRRVLALTVDHGVHPDSPAWTRFARDQARALGCDWRALAWRGPKPATGLPAAARGARHALLAEAAREAGACVLLMGHTADDVLEGERMRATDAPTLGRLRAWAPSPVWPEGRGVFLLRPLLDVRRAALRDWLRAQGARWLEDPANDDPRFARARARAHPSPPSWGRGQGEGGLVAPDSLPDEASSAPGPISTRQCVGQSPPSPCPLRHDGGEGSISISTGELTPSVLSAALLCTAGTERPPRGEAVARLMAKAHSGAPFTATLAGARVTSNGDGLLITREPGERARGGLAPLPLTPERPTVWDGRFELLADAEGLTVAALAGHATRLSTTERRNLSPLPAAARASLPALIHEDGSVSLPAPFGSGPAKARSLVQNRFDAALGLIPDERAAAARAQALLGVRAAWRDDCTRPIFSPS